MNPKHTDPRRKNRVAKAPYNFVPLPEAILTIEKPPDADRYHPELLTGRLVCTLTTSSPLYVRAALTPEQYARRKPDDPQPSEPFHGETTEDLLIPGSSLRGMLRSLVEVVSYSRTWPVTHKPLFYRTVDDSSIGRSYRGRMTGDDKQKGWFPLAQAGYLELIGSDYYIRPAREILETGHYRVDEAVALQKAGGLRKMATSQERTDRQGRTRTYWSPNRDYHPMRMQVWFRPVAPKTHEKTHSFFAEVTDIEGGDQKPAGNGWERGWLVAGGWVPSKGGGRGKRRHWIIGPPNMDLKTEQLIPVADEDIDLYRERGAGTTQFTEKWNLSVLPKKEGPGNGIPCFYVQWAEDEKKRLAFGHTGMFRLPYRKSPADMLPDSLLNETGWDMAEAIFGAVRQDDGKTLAGRVFVSDAHFVGTPEQARQALLPVQQLSDQALSSPKPTTFQHYLTQPEPDDSNTLRHYDHPKTETTLRGAKFYWHVGDTAQQAERLKTAPAPRPNDTFNRFQPVKAGQSFRFEIHFENLRPEELGALLWVLDRAQDPQYRLRLGMGKPFGFGSIALRASVFLTDRKQRYTGRAEADQRPALFRGTAWNEAWLPEEAANARLTEARRQFESFVLGNPAVNPTQQKRVEDLPRIRELLALLDWEGRPDPGETQYMILDQFTGREPVLDLAPGDKPTRRPVLPKATTVKAGLGNLLDGSTRPAGDRGRQGGPQPAGGQRRPSPPEPRRDPVSTPTPIPTPPPAKPQTPPPAGYQRGRVKEFGKDGKSYGFIIPEKGGQDIFVHRSGLAPGVATLLPGQWVIYRLVQGERGQQAADVHLDE